MSFSYFSLMTRVFQMMLVLVMPLALASCGAGFRREWNRAPAADGVHGRWSGSWKSEVNGHSGFLRCVVKEGSSPEKKTFIYRAGWMKILATTINTEKVVTKTHEGWKFTGGKDLGSFGEFSSTGTIKGDDFSARYESALDKGSFTMKRVSD